MTLAAPHRARSLLLLPLLGLAACEPAADDAPIETVVTAAGDEMLLLPAGDFIMGSNSGEADESPAHEVHVDAFLIDRHEVTQAMFARLELSDPSHFQGADRPVDNLTWVQAARFCNARSRAEGLEPVYDEETAEADFSKTGYRLPTEAEWEYAARAGTTGDYGSDSDPRRLPELAWYRANAGSATHPVGTRSPNAWGLEDMLGNVAEWCNEPYAPGYDPSRPADNPRGPATGELYVVRGGSWSSTAAALRLSARGRDRPGFGDACLAPDTLGLRCVRKGPVPSP